MRFNCLGISSILNVHRCPPLSHRSTIRCIIPMSVFTRTHLTATVRGVHAHTHTHGAFRTCVCNYVIKCSGARAPRNMCIDIYMLMCAHVFTREYERESRGRLPNSIDGLDMYIPNGYVCISICAHRGGRQSCN